MSDPIFKSPRIPARLSFNGGPMIEGEITDLKIGGYAHLQLSSAMAEAALESDTLSFTALEKYRKRLATEAQARRNAHARETLGFQSSCAPGAPTNGFAEFPFDLTFEHVAMLQARSRDKSGLNGCCGLTCNPTTYRWILNEAKNAAVNLFTRNNGSGTFLCGIELFEVRDQKETALAWYDAKAMREYLETHQ